jgi:hypothetical protein
MTTDILRQDFHSGIIHDWVDWVHQLAAWRRLINSVTVLIAASAFWAAILWPILSFFR